MNYMNNEIIISTGQFKSFINELAIFKDKNSITREINSKKYDDIAACLIKGRSNAIKKLQSTITKMQNEDPLNPAFLGVSLFKILHGTGLRETAHTRMLTWLLNPQENHGFSYDILRAFLSTVTDENWVLDKSLTIIKVHAERRLSQSGRRTDIWLEGKVSPQDVKNELKWLVIVEAKVESFESEFQLSDYSKEAKKWFENSPTYSIQPLLVFLTKDEIEIESNGDSDWKQITFDQLADTIWRAAKLGANASGIHLVRHYLSGVLSDMYGWSLPITKSNDQYDIYSTLSFLRTNRK
jgi:hypothetical protein